MFFPIQNLMFFVDILLILSSFVITDQLDGIKKRHSSDSSPQHMMDYLQLPDDYETRSSAPGKRECVPIYF